MTQQPARAATVAVQRRAPRAPTSAGVLPNVLPKVVVNRAVVHSATKPHTFMGYSLARAAQHRVSAHEVQRLNGLRRKMVPPLVVEQLLIIAAGAGLLMFALTSRWHPLLVTMLPLPLAVSVMLLMALRYRHHTVTFRQDYKRSLVGHYLRRLDDKAVFAAERGVGSHIFAHSMLFLHAELPSAYFSEDLMALRTAEHGRLVCSEVYAHRQEERQRSVIFKGLLGLTAIDEQPPDMLVVKSKRHEQAFAVAVGFQKRNYEDLAVSSDILRRVVVNDAAFEARYSAYVLNAAEGGEVILNERFRTGLMRLRHELGCEVEVSVGHGLLFVALPVQRDLFDPPILRPITVAGVVRDLLLLEGLRTAARRLGLTPLAGGQADESCGSVTSAAPASGSCPRRPRGNGAAEKRDYACRHGTPAPSSR